MSSLEEDFLTEAVKNAVFHVLSKLWHNTPASSIVEYFDPSIMKGKVPDVVIELCAATYHQIEVSLMEELSSVTLRKYKFPEKVRVLEQLFIDAMMDQIDIVEDACLFQYETEVQKQEEEIARLETLLAKTKDENERLLQRLDEKYTRAQPILEQLDDVVKATEVYRDII